MIEYRLCEKFGWLPSDLDRQPERTINKFITIMSIENQLQKAEAERGQH